MKITKLIPLIIIGTFCISMSNLALAENHRQHRKGVVHQTVNSADVVAGTAVKETGRTVKNVGRAIAAPFNDRQ